MNTPLKIALPIALLILVSCTAQMVVPPGGAEIKYAPTNQSNKRGIVKYHAYGAYHVVAARREDALKKMHTACSGKYIIVREGMRPENVYTMSANTMSPTSVSGSTNAVYIVFECLE